MLRIKLIGLEVRRGQKSYEAGQKEMMPLLVELNSRGKAIAKRFNKKFYPVTFTKAVRLNF